VECHISRQIVYSNFLKWRNPTKPRKFWRSWPYYLRTTSKEYKRSRNSLDDPLGRSSAVGSSVIILFRDPNWPLLQVLNEINLVLLSSVVCTWLDLYGLSMGRHDHSTRIIVTNMAFSTREVFLYWGTPGPN
jgi:hypothetical protein